MSCATPVKATGPGPRAFILSTIRLYFSPNQANGGDIVVPSGQGSGMVIFTNIRHIGGALLCALLATSCASSAWKKDPNVVSGRWEISPAAAAAADTLPPRNELTFADVTPATSPATGPATRPATTRPVRRRIRPALTGMVTLGSEASKSGAAGSTAHLDFHCGTGKKGTCTVVVQVETPVSHDNEHLELKLERINSAGEPVGSSRAMTRQAGVLQGQTLTYELSVKPCGKVRLTAAAMESARGREGVQSRWNVRILRFRCH